MADGGLDIRLKLGTAPPDSVVEVTAADVLDHGVVFCPNPKMKLWSTHPRVFIGVTNGPGKCPYCGTEYRLAPGEAVHHGH